MALRGTDWSEEEVVLCVNAYFEYLIGQLNGETSNKAQLYRVLAEQTGRTGSSIEFKFQNISAVLDVMGREWITGLAPLANYQELLAEKVGQHIAAIDSIPLRQILAESVEGFHDHAAFFIEPPPELKKTVNNIPPYIAHLIRKFDPVIRDANNKLLGNAGEEFVFNHEKRFLSFIGRKDLSDNVRWVAKEDGDGSGYDILSFTDKGEKKFLEVKTTVGGIRTPFFVSRNEYSFCKENADHFSLIRLFNFRRGMRGFELLGHLDQHVNLSTETYRAEFVA